MSPPRTLALVAAVALASLAPAAAEEPDCVFAPDAAEHFNVNFEQNARGVIQSLTVVQISVNVNNIFQSDAKACLEQGQLRVSWSSATAAHTVDKEPRRRRGVLTWILEDTVKPCQLTTFHLHHGDQQLERQLEARTEAELVELGYRLGKPANLVYLNVDQVLSWDAVQCATGYTLDIGGEDGAEHRSLVTTDTSLGVAELPDCGRQLVYITPWVASEENAKYKDELEWSFTKIPDFSSGFLSVSRVAATSADMKVALSSLRCVESCSLELAAVGGADSRVISVDGGTQLEDVLVEELLHDTTYSLAIQPRPLHPLAQPIPRIELTSFTTPFDESSLRLTATGVGCCSVHLSLASLPRDTASVAFQRQYSGQHWEDFSPLEPGQEVRGAPSLAASTPETPCAEASYRAEVRTEAGLTFTAATEDSVLLQLSPSDTLASVAAASMARAAGQLTASWLPLPCVTRYEVSLCAADSDCAAEVFAPEPGTVAAALYSGEQLQYSHEELDPCLDYTVTITPVMGEESLISSWVESFEADFEETPVDIRVSHSEDGATVSLSWAEAACTTDYQLSLVPAPESGAEPLSPAVTREDNILVASLPSSEVAACEQYEAGLVAEYHGAARSLASGLQLGVLAPALAPAPQLRLEGTNLTWTASPCALSYTVVVKDSADTEVMAETLAQVSRGLPGTSGEPLLQEGEDTLEVELLGLATCQQYTASLLTAWRDVALPGGGELPRAPASEEVRLLDERDCITTTPKPVAKKPVKANQLRMPNVRAGSAGLEARIAWVLVISLFTAAKVF